jgi:ATP-dependent Lon protease
MMVPPGLTPKPQPYAGIAIFDAENSKYLGLIQDPKGQDVKALTGITFHGNKLYLGSLHNDYIAVYDLS